MVSYYAESILEESRNRHGVEGIVTQFVNESQVAADRLIAVVEGVNESIERLTDIADLSTMQEEQLRTKQTYPE